MHKHLFILSLLMTLITHGFCQSYEDQLVIENNLFSKTFGYHLSEGGAISVEISTNLSDNPIATSENMPFFSFVINNSIVSSNDPLWVYRSSSTRQMGNDGTEYTIVFEGVKRPVEGLQVKLLQQVFPGSTLIREKLILQTEQNSFQLNKLDEKLHFKFPSYGLSRGPDNTLKGTEIRIASFNKKPITFGDKKKGNHMYYPDINPFELSEEVTSVKGPISIVNNGKISWVSTYEHASQDDLNGMFKKPIAQNEGNLINDAMQGTKGVFNFSIDEDDFKFLGISSELENDQINISVEILRGGYLEGEVIDRDHPYATVWNATAFYKGSNLEDGKAILRHYLFNQICEKSVSRIPEFYYNTWGMQRNDRNKPLRGILTYDRIFEEIDYAAELGVDIFVLDDGWENAQGEWFPNQARFPEGLSPIKEKLDQHGMKMGLWYSPMGIDSTTQRYKNNPQWVIKDSEGHPISAQWDHPAFDFVSDFFNVFIEDCKKMIDEGCLFMKWDAINTFYSSLPNLHHGSEEYSEEELRARYEYLLPVYVVRAMEILTNYQPNLVIEIDLTEARRVMTGLAPLSQGKLFWMNNGASTYNDYSAFRTQSMRTIANEFAGIIPLELFTYANYPHNLAGKMEYNVHNSLLAGHGFWGNLELMNSAERTWIGKQVKLSRQVLPYLVNVNPKVIGEVGDSPEIYEIVNDDEAAGQVIAFTSKPIKTEVKVHVKMDKMLASLNNPYTTSKDHLIIPIDLKEKESSVAVIIIPNLGKGVSITSSTSPITDAVLQEDKLIYHLSHAGRQSIIADKKLGKPRIFGSKPLTSAIDERDSSFQIEVEAEEPDCEVTLYFEK